MTSQTWKYSLLSEHREFQATRKLKDSLPDPGYLLENVPSILLTQSVDFHQCQELHLRGQGRGEIVRTSD